MKSTPSPSAIRNPQSALAALAVSLSAAAAAAAPGEIRLIPAGNFKAADGSGRPEGIASGWLLNAALAQRLVALAAARTSDYVIDYEHQSLRAVENGQPAPAAGWFKQLEWRAGDGLYAVDVRWTERAAALIAAQEYRYLSPVFAYHPRSGAVIGLGPAALTNNPGLDGLTDLAALSSLISSTENSMDIEELLERVRYLLNLPTLTTPEEVAAELQKAVDAIKAGGAAETVAATAQGIVGAYVALKAAAPDPALYAPVAVMQELQAQVAALGAEKTARAIDAVVSAALTAGKLLPSQEAWARELGRSNLALLQQHVDASCPVSALSGTQTGGKAPPASSEAMLPEGALAVCSALGISPEEFRKTQAGL